MIEAISKTDTGSASHYSFDVNYDTPIGDNGGALTAYASFIEYNFGENGSSSAAATGNAFYGQLGYLIPKTKFQPYAAYQNRNYNNPTVLASQRAGNTFNLGANYYVAGHNLKFTLEYLKSSFETGDDTSQIRFQAHISI